MNRIGPRREGRAMRADYAAWTVLFIIAVLVTLAAKFLSACSFPVAAYFTSGSHSAGKVEFCLLPLFMLFLKIGSVVFGNGCGRLESGPEARH